MKRKSLFILVMGVLQKSLIFLGILLLIPTLCFAASSSWFTSDQASVRVISSGFENNRLLMGVEFRLKPGWKIYWKNPGDSGFPVTITPTPIANAVYKVLWPVPHRTVDRFEDTTSETYTYSDNVIIPIIFSHVNPNNPLTTTIHLEYGICNKICIPETTSLTIDIPANHQDNSFTQTLNQAIAKTPRANGTNGLMIDHIVVLNTNSNPILQVVARSASGFKRPNLFMDGGDLSISAPSVNLSNQNQTAIFTAPLALAHKNALNAPTLELVLTDNEMAVNQFFSQEDITFSKGELTPPLASNNSLGLMFLFALIGGLILNIMPCVLPILSLKVMSVLGLHGQKRLHISGQFLTTAAGIIFSFFMLALLLLALKTGGMQVGWGFHFQQPYFIVFLVLALTLFTASMWDILHFTLPGSWNFLTKEYKHSTLNHFLTGCFATLLATPCTAPFLGTAAGFALSQSGIIILGMFVTMGIGMAIPYLILALIPGLVFLLPKPGRWMVTFKYSMGVLMALTALWLIWVLSVEWGKTSALWLFIICSTLLVFLAYSQHTKRWLILFGALAFLVSSLLANTMPNKPIDNSFWVAFDEKAIPSYLEQGKTVFIDITAAWCLTCKYNKISVLNQPSIQALLKQPNVIAMKGDWTNKDPAIEQFLARHKRAGVPFNIIYSPNVPQGLVLPELLSIKTVRDAFNKN